jgi:hypothetical protein
MKATATRVASFCALIVACLFLSMGCSLDPGSNPSTDESATLNGSAQVNVSEPEAAASFSAGQSLSTLEQMKEDCFVTQTGELQFVNSYKSVTIEVFLDGAFVTVLRGGEHYHRIVLEGTHQVRFQTGYSHTCPVQSVMVKKCNTTVITCAVDRVVIQSNATSN